MKAKVTKIKTKKVVKPRVRQEPPLVAFRLSPDSVRRIGKVVGGTHWQADMARELACSKSMITKVLNGSRVSDSILSEGIRGVMIRKIEKLNELLSLPDLPYGTDATTEIAQARIREAIARLDTLG
jgi:hypothetical protein